MCVRALCMLLVLIAHLDDDREHTFMCKDGNACLSKAHRCTVLECHMHTRRAMCWGSMSFLTNLLEHQKMVEWFLKQLSLLVDRTTWVESVEDQLLLESCLRSL